MSNTRNLRGAGWHARGRLAGLCAAVAALATPALHAAEPATAAPENVLIALLREEAQALEHGEGQDKDPERAAALYCKAARLGDVQSQVALGWLYANGRGVPRSDGTAAFFFQAAAEQGYEQAANMLKVVGGPTSEVPDCLREPSAPQRPQQQPVPAGRAKAPPVALAQTFNAPPNLLKLAHDISGELKVPVVLTLAIMEAESNFNVAALSPKQAKGLMQLIPDTAARFGVRNPWDAAQNIRGGAGYLRWLLAYFEGDVALVAAAYNAGEGTVERYRGIPPYVETRAYVRRILQSTGAALLPFDPSATRPSAWLGAIRAPRRSL